MKVSKNYDRGRKITSIKQVQVAAENKEALWTRQWGVKAAAVLLSQSVRNLQRLIDRDNVYRIVKRYR